MGRGHAPASLCRQEGRCEKVSLTAFKTDTNNKFDLECKCVQTTDPPRARPTQRFGPVARTRQLRARGPGRHQDAGRQPSSQAQSPFPNPGP